MNSIYGYLATYNTQAHAAQSSPTGWKLHFLLLPTTMQSNRGGVKQTNSAGTLSLLQHVSPMPSVAAAVRANSHVATGHSPPNISLPVNSSCNSFLTRTSSLTHSAAYLRSNMWHTTSQTGLPVIAHVSVPVGTLQPPCKWPSSTQNRASATGARSTHNRPIRSKISKK